MKLYIKSSKFLLDILYDMNGVCHLSLSIISDRIFFLSQGLYFIMFSILFIFDCTDNKRVHNEGGSELSSITIIKDELVLIQQKPNICCLLVL